MKVTMDRSGRVMLPAQLRKAMALEEGDRFTVRQVGDRIELVPEPAAVEMKIDEDGFPILVGETPGWMVSNDEVVDAIHAAREERIDQLLGVRR